MSDSSSSGASIVVTEKASKVNLLFGFLTVVFGAALVRGHLGAGTALGRAAVDVIFGALLAGTVATWVWLRRHPARLEISPEEIALMYRGGRRSQRLMRTSGDLYVRMSGGKYPRPYLRTPGSDEALPMLTFDRAQVIDACIATGWRFRS